MSIDDEPEPRALLEAAVFLNGDLAAPAAGSLALRGPAAAG